MATNYPGSLDSGTQQPSPSATTEMDDSGFEHDVVHTNHSGAIIALETKVGTGDSNAVANSVLAGTGSGTSGWTTTPTVTGLTVNGDTGSTGHFTAQSGGADSGIVLGQAFSTDYVGLRSAGMAEASGDEYVLISDGTTTLLSGGTNGDVYIRGGANNSSCQIFLDTSENKIGLTGKVGIGTTSPNNMLSFGTPANGSRQIGLYENGTAHYGMGTDVNRLAFYASNSAGTAERMVINSDGDVGIGTTSPSVPLHLNIGTGNSGILVESTDATARINMKDSSTSGNSYVGIGAVGNDMSLWAGNAKKMTILSDGKVGIGTTAPDTNLEVVGSVRASTSFLVGGSGDDGIGPVTGQYGSVQTRGTGVGSYEGYSINGHFVFMSNSTEVCGIYNDVDNQWMLLMDADSYTRLYDSDGIVAFGANDYTSGGTGAAGNGYVGVSTYCGGFSGTTAVMSTTTVAGVSMKRLGFSSSSYEYKTAIADLAMSDEAFMSLKPITFHPNNQYVDSTGNVTEIAGGHTIVPDSTEAGETDGLMPLRRAGFGLEDLYSREDTMILATEFAPDSNALIALLTLKLQETMARVDVLETV